MRRPVFLCTALPSGNKSLPAFEKALGSATTSVFAEDGLRSGAEPRGHSEAYSARYACAERFQEKSQRMAAF